MDAPDDPSLIHPWYRAMREIEADPAKYELARAAAAEHFRASAIAIALEIALDERQR